MYQQMIFVNLATNDLDAAKKFFAGLGWELNAQFSDDSTASFPVSDTIVVMVHTPQKYREFTKRRSRTRRRPARC